MSDARISKLMSVPKGSVSFQNSPWKLHPGLFVSKVMDAMVPERDIMKAPTHREPPAETLPGADIVVNHRAVAMSYLQ